MYLRRLEVHGFKSFATRVTLDFGPGITAVVGPNGCGKSNVADALRWVLGEQSAKLLRSRKLEDVIFAGSSRRPPAAAAGVSLTLDNSDGWLSLDATEVTITRKAYRFGESAYLLNGRRSRLRDVADLLLKARSGQGSYAVMGQGLVESILNFRPDERRLLLEEAADLQGYRLNLEEARQRLVATQENMERVGLLLQEMTPHLAQLERQARRSSRRVVLERELNQALRSWYGHTWREAQRALTKADAEQDAALVRCQEAQTELAQWEERLETIRRQLDQERSGETSGASRLARVRESRSRLQQEVNLGQQRQTLLASRSRELQEEIRALDAEGDRLAQALAEDDRREAALRRELTSLGEALDAQEGALASAEEELAERRRRAEAAEEGAAEARAAATAAQSRLQGWLEAQERKPDPAVAPAHLGQATARLRELARDYADLRRQERALGARLEALRPQISQMEGSLAEETRLLNTQRDQMHQTEVRLERVQARLHALEETAAPELPAAKQLQLLPPALPVRSPVAMPPVQLSLWRRFLAQLARLLPAFGGPAKPAAPFPRAAAALAPPATPPADLPGVLAIVAQVIQVPLGLEKAITAALADRAEALVVANRRDALAAARVVAQQGGPRTVILPLDDIQTVYPPYLLREPGVLGVASALVRCAERYRPLVNALLGRTVVVENLETAQQVLRRGMGSVVTRDGVLLHPTGLVSSGSGVALRRHHDLRALPRQIRRLEVQKSQLDAQVASLASAVSRKEAALEAVRQEMETLTAQRHALKDELALQRQRIGRSQGEIRSLLGRQGAPAAQVDTAIQRAPSSERTFLEREHQHLAAAAAGAEAVAQRERAALAAANQRREALSRELSATQRKAATLRGQLQSLQELRQSRREALSRLQPQTRQRQSQWQSLREETEAIEGRLAGRAEALARMERWLSSQAAQGQEPRLAELERELRGAEQALTAARHELLNAERHRLETAAGLQHHQDELASLRRRLGEDGFAVSQDGLVFAPDESGRPMPPWPAMAGQDDSAPGGLADPKALEEQIERLRSQLRALGVVNPEAEEEYSRLKERQDFLISQMADLQGADRSLRQAIQELEETMGQRFAATFQQVGQEFQRYFVTFFGGGYAKLILTPPEDYKSSGVDIIAQPPGKRLQSLNMLSGGEKALTAIAFLFALLQTSPSPFCLLDEVDASLDDANIGRFVNALRELAQRTQFVVISHNRRTIEAADRIYGVAMGPENVSQVLSLQLADIPAG